MISICQLGLGIANTEDAVVVWKGLGLATSTPWVLNLVLSFDQSGNLRCVSDYPSLFSHSLEYGIIGVSGGSAGWAISSWFPLKS